MLERPSAGASQGRSTSIAALEPRYCAGDNAASVGAKGALDDEREGTGADGEYKSCG